MAKSSKKTGQKSALSKLKGGVGMGKPSVTRKPNGAKKPPKSWNIG
jgi:hypothetical protein